MPALVAGIHVLLSRRKQGVDGRDKPGHDVDLDSSIVAAVLTEKIDVPRIGDVKLALDNRHGSHNCLSSASFTREQSTTNVVGIAACPGQDVTAVTSPPSAAEVAAATIPAAAKSRM